MFTVGHCLSIMIRRFLLFATLLSLSSPLRLIFRRSGVAGSGNIITLICRDEQDMAIDLRMNDSIKFFVNRTFEHDEQSLDRLVQLTMASQGTSASFQITPELEGNYACGIVGAQRGTGTSDSMPLVGEFFFLTILVQLTVLDGHFLLNFSTANK